MTFPKATRRQVNKCNMRLGHFSISPCFQLFSTAMTRRPRSQLRLISLLAILCNCPLAIANFLLFLAYHHHPTVTKKSPSLGINIAQWLSISAYFQLNYIAFFVFVLINCLCCGEDNKFLLLVSLALKLFHGIFQLSWLALAAILHGRDQLANYQKISLYIWLVVFLQVGLLLVEQLAWFWWLKSGPSLLRKKTVSPEIAPPPLPTSNDCSNNQLNK